MKNTAVLFLLFMAAFTCHAQKIKLALHLTKSNTYDMVSTSTSTIKQNIKGQENNINISLSATISFKVLGANDSLYYMEVVYKGVNMKMSLPTGEVSFSSGKKDSTEVMSSILNRMTDKPFTATFTKSGKIRSIENLENMISSVLDGFPQVQGIQKEQIKARFMKSFGSQSVKGSIELATAVLPEVPVAKNDKWQTHTTLQTTMSANVETTYQLVGVTPTSYLIHGEGTIVTIPAEPGTSPMKYDMKGTMVSDIKVDKTTGWITESKTRQNINGTMTIKDNPDTPGGITFPVSMTGETIITDR
jgi:hypothetical protein